VRPRRPARGSPRRGACVRGTAARRRTAAGPADRPGQHRHAPR
jgi:hypothetical protein